MLVKPPPSVPITLSLSSDLRIWLKDRRSATDQKIPATQLHGHNIDPTYHNRHRYCRQASGGVTPKGNRVTSSCQSLRRIPSMLHKVTPLRRIQDSHTNAHASCVLYHGKWQVVVSKSNTRLCNMLLMVPYRIAVCK